jgi:GT2 family glycosyltransferase
MDESLDSVTELPDVSIVIPAYGAAEVLLRCLKSLARHVPSKCAVSVVDDATPDDSVRKACEDIQPHFPQLSYHRSEQNRGFVGTCNFACQHLRKRGADLLLLNSDTEVTAGFLEEMQAILHLHDRHAVVTPRSNNATIFSVPWRGGTLPAAESYRVWKRIKELLPRYRVMPTAVGFCMLIKAEVLERFGLFDEVYSPGYNEENDFVCRINRYGYSAVAANLAYVFHHEGSSFGSRGRCLETVNRQTLWDRYPEYQRKVADYPRFFVDPVETFANLYAPHRCRILFDLFDWPTERSKSCEFALNLFRELSRQAGDDIELYAGLRESQAFFARELSGHRIYNDDTTAQLSFDLVFRPSQIFTWDELCRMNRLAPRVSYLSLGVIGVRSDYLSSPERQIFFDRAAELSDCVFTISEFARTDFESFYGRDMPMRIIHDSTSPQDWRGVGEQYLAAFREILAKDVDLTRLRSRWATLRMLGSKCSQ